MDELNILSVLTTTGDKLPDLEIKNGQLIFIPNSYKIALDFNDTRNFFNQVEIIDTEEERTALSPPRENTFYFVIETKILWFYRDSWIRVTADAKNNIFIGSLLPENKDDNIMLYVDKTNKSISIWDEESENFEVVGQQVIPITEEEIDRMFI